ncbi:MAG: acetate--CoA ligase family protein [Lentisphaerae bacterium]|nr:acetate--CoA ligase family protein [Lentisphaerota bacterium]
MKNDPLLEPESVAVVGASRSAGKVGHTILANLLRSRFPGAVIPVNPSAESILDLPCYASLEAYGKPVDLCIVVVPFAAVPDAVSDAVRAGAGAVIVITAGFKEVGEAGAEAERRIAEQCRAARVRLLGPNCLGVINTHRPMDASFAKKFPERGAISFISQSGALMSAILDTAAERRLGLSKLISIGNKADLDETDLLTALAGDETTRVIVGYLESIANGNAFIKAAERTASRKPVVIFKSGVTRAGVQAASSHTGSLAGADIAYGAAFKRAGVIRADTFEAMFDFSTAFAMQPLPAGNRVAVITNAGGPGIMAADAVEGAGMTMAELDRAASDALKALLPPAASVANPIDVLGDADAERYAAALKTALEDPGVDACVVLLTPQAVTEPAATAQAIADRASREKPILVSFMGGEDVGEARRLLTAAGVPDYPSPERAIASLKAMCEYNAWLRRPPRVVTRFPVNRRRVERIIRRHVRTRQWQVGEAFAKDILRAYDFTVPPGDAAATSGDAVEQAEKIGYPVAMKIMSPDIVHKSDIGGVRLNLASPEEVRDAFDLMMMRIRQAVPSASITGVYIEKMCGRGREVILGMTRDPQFGPMLMFGLGGIFVEVMKDVTFHIAPITADEAMQMLESTKSFALLKGVRGQRSVDLSAIAEALQRISQLATDFDCIAEMDINPFIVGRVGEDSVAADARIRLKETKTPSRR